MQAWRLPAAVIDRLYREARADRWAVPVETFAAALERSAARAFDAEPDARGLERYVASLHLEDLALACACAEGHDTAWEYFVNEYRLALYRAADAIDPTGGAREQADSLYGELFGLREHGGARRSHFDYFHGRSSLATWLRAVLSQRYVDRLRSVGRFDPLPEDETPGALPSRAEPENTELTGHLDLMRRVFSEIVSGLPPRDRLRLSCYYARNLTLAETGRALREHEATVSRNLARARTEIRTRVERYLRDHEGMSEAAIAECFATVTDDVGSLDVADLLGTPAPDRAETAEAITPLQPPRKKAREDRSKEREEEARA
jgi:RNA polymerase sigma factor (sigma-70 family)